MFDWQHRYGKPAERGARTRILEQGSQVARRRREYRGAAGAEGV